MQKWLFFIVWVSFKAFANGANMIHTPFSISIDKNNGKVFYYNCEQKNDCDIALCYLMSVSYLENIKIKGTQDELVLNAEDNVDPSQNAIQSLEQTEEVPSSEKSSFSLNNMIKPIAGVVSNGFKSLRSAAKGFIKNAKRIPGLLTINSSNNIRGSNETTPSAPSKEELYDAQQCSIAVSEEEYQKENILNVTTSPTTPSFMSRINPLNWKRQGINASNGGQINDEDGPEVDGLSQQNVRTRGDFFGSFSMSSRQSQNNPSAPQGAVITPGEPSPAQNNTYVVAFATPVNGSNPSYLPQ